jgi:hypothetical protein
MARVLSPARRLELRSLNVEFSMEISLNRFCTGSELLQCSSHDVFEFILIFWFVERSSNNPERTFGLNAFDSKRLLRDLAESIGLD